MAASGPRTLLRLTNAEQADQPGDREAARKCRGRSTKLGAVATGQSSWRASVVFDHHWAVPVREHQLGGHSACAGLDGRQVISAIKTDILRCRLAGRRGPWGSAVFDPSPRGRVDRDQLFRRQHVGTLGDGDALIGLGRADRSRMRAVTIVGR